MEEKSRTIFSIQKILNESHWCFDVFETKEKQFERYNNRKNNEESFFLNQLVVANGMIEN